MRKFSIVLAALTSIAVAAPTIACAQDKPMDKGDMDKGDMGMHHKKMHHHRMHMMHHHKMMMHHKKMMEKQGT
jgi:hypothetical protein